MVGKSHEDPSPTRRGVLAGAGIVGVGGIFARHGNSTTASNGSYASDAGTPMSPPLVLAAAQASSVPPVTAPGGLQVGGAWWIPPSGDTTGVTDTANISGALSSGYEVLLLPGTYYVTPGQVVVGLNQYLRGPGKSMCTINGAGSGTGPVVQIGNPTGVYQELAFAGISGVWVSSYALGAGCPALQVGDVPQIEIGDVATAGNADSPGFLARNSLFWTEQLHGTLFAKGGPGSAPMVQFDRDRGTKSFDRPDLTIYVDQGFSGTSNGIAFTNGAVVAWGRLSIFGNFKQPPAGSPAPVLLSFSGSTDTPAGIYRSHLDIGVEFEGSVSTVNGPRTISFVDAAGNQGFIEDCYGLIDVHAYGSYAGAGWLPSDNNQNFRFHGPVYGDLSLLVGIGSQDTSPQNAGAIWSGFPGGWVGKIQYRKMDDADLVFIQWQFAINPSTAVTAGEIVTPALPAPFFFPSDKRILPGTLFGGESGYAAGALLPTGQLSFYGNSFTPSVKTYWAGQAIISNSL